MPATDFLLQGGYFYLLIAQFAAFAIFSLLGIGYAFHSHPRRVTLIFVALTVVGASSFFANEAPQVYYDEFFYASVAANMQTRKCAEPLIWQDTPPHIRELGFFQPPYPQGWPFILSIGQSCVNAPEPGSHEKPFWEKTLVSVRCLHMLMPGLLYLFLRRRFKDIPAVCAALLLAGLPQIRLLAGCAAAETGALFCLLVVCLAYEELRCRCRIWQLLWLYLAASSLAEMRPEAMILALAAVVLGTLNISGKIRSRNIWLCLVVCAVFFLPPFIVMGSHDASLDHHFQSVPRAGLSMMQNRLANLGGNALFFVSNKIWPLGITVLAIAGIIGAWCRRAGSAEENVGFTKQAAIFCMVWVLGITALLSMFPFGDYECLNSIDTWRYSWHVMVPMLMAAAAGISFLSAGSKTYFKPRLAVVTLILAASFLPLFMSPIISKPHPLERLRSLCKKGTQDISGYVVCSQPEYYAFLRFGMGLPAVLAPISELPAGQTALLWDVSEDGTGVPHLDMWERFDLEPVVYEGDDVPQAGVFIIKSPGDDL